MKILDPCCGSRMMWFNKQNQTQTHWIVFLKESHIGDSRMEAEEWQREKEHFEKWARSIGANDERLKWVDV